ncbi:MAG: diguanylate cyclase domain-containing protein [Halanaerobium sp.]
MRNLFAKYKYLIIILISLTIIIISYINYQSTRELIESKYEDRQQLVEKNILNTINQIDTSYKIAESHLNEEMKEYSQIMLEKYRDNPEVQEWDLEELKDRFEDYEIYIVNRDLEVIKTTYQPDSGLEFSQFPNFARVLEERLKGDSFAVDRLDISTQAGDLKKYSYMPTPDNQYLLELSINIQKRYSELEDLDMFKDAKELISDYNIVEEISFYRVETNQQSVGKLRSEQEPYLDPDISELETELAVDAVRTNQTQTRINQVNNNNYNYKFFPALISDQTAEEADWAHYVVGIQYNNSSKQAEISHHRNLFLINGLIMIAVLLFFMGVLISLIQDFEYQAYHDQLTGLANRELFGKLFTKLKNKVRKNDDKQLAMLFLDIDNFKEINDRFGHDTGDQVLKKIAERLEKNLRPRDKLSRMGGDEFVIIIPEIDSSRKVIQIAERIIEEFNRPLIIGESKLFISLSLGISLYPEHGNKLEELIQKADDSMYKAKQKQENFVLYEENE